MNAVPLSAAEVVRRAWAGAVEMDAFEAADDFFALGGDSVSAALVARRVGVAAGVDIPPRTLFQHPTFQAFADFVSARQRATPLSVPPRPDPSTHPLAPGQERLWLLHQLHPDRATYTVGTVIEMVGSLDQTALAVALDALVARHEPLRTVIDDAGEVAVARVAGSGPIAIEAVSATDAERARALAADFLARPLPLAEGWPMRVQLVRLNPGHHWLVLAIHHIATDGESERILLDELGQVYTAALAATAPPLARLAVGYGDVAAYRAARPDAIPAARLARRCDEISGHVDHPLALEGGDPEQASGVGARHRRWLGRPVAGAVRTCASKLRTTVFITLLAGFADTVARWSGSDDVCLAYPVSVREPAPARDLVGFFVDTCVVRIDLAGRPTFASVIGRAHRAVVEAATEPVPFDAVAEAVAATRGSRRPLFRAWFNHLGAPPPPPVMAGLVTRVLDLPVPPALFDLNVYLVEDDGDIRVDLVRDVALCSADAAEEFLDQYVALIARAVAAAGEPLRSHRPDTPRSSLLPCLADPLTTARPPSLARQLATIGRRRASSVAVRDADGDVTYRQLRAAVHELATALRTAGVGPGDTVAVLGHRDVGLVTSMLATWAAGARLLLLDPEYPAARLAGYLTVARPRCLVTGPEPGPDLGVPGLVVLDRVTAAVVRVAGPGTDRGSDGPGYLAFTSGTTGEPVAVAGGLGPIEHFLAWYAAENELDENDRFAMLAGVSHDPVFRDVLLPLVSGATLSIPPPAARRAPGELARWLGDQEISVANLTPPLARLISAEAIRLPALRLLCLGGDALTAADVDNLIAIAPAAVLLNGYGTTETPQLVSRRRVSPPQPPTLGAQVPGSQLLVVADDGERCGIGEAGRIVVRSRHLATIGSGDRAYRGQVVADPVQGVGRFPTGDLGRYRTDGSVDYLGRHDDIVNVRGFRAHPGETDRALAGDPRVAASVTVSWSGPDGAELVSYVVGDDLAAIRARLATLLPSHLVPTTIVSLSRLPLTANGKVDRAALPAPRRGQPTTRVAAAPTGSLEHRLAQILSGMLGLNSVDVAASLFELGATSLHLLRLHSAIRRDIDARLPLLVLYESPSIRALARRLADQAPVPEVIPAAMGERRGSRTDERARRLAARQHMPEPARESR